MGFVTKYQNYQLVKYEYYWWQRMNIAGTFQRISIPKRKWERITMDFAVVLSKMLRKCDSIQVIIDQQAKLDHFIPVRVHNNAAKLSKIYVKETVRLHGVPVLFCIRQKSLVHLQFLREVKLELGQRLDLSTAFQLQIDDHSEQTIQLIEEILWAFTIDLRDITIQTN